MKTRRSKSTLVVALAVTLSLLPLPAFAEGEAAAQAPTTHGHHWEEAEHSTLDDGGDVAAFDGPHVRIGVHGQGGAVFGDYAGGFAGLDLLLGARLLRDFSVISRIDIDLGAWDHPAGSPYLGGALGLGGEYVAQTGRGTGVALGLTVGAWLRGACQTPQCLSTLLPTTTGHLAFLFNGNHVSENPLSAFSLGVSGSAGYDPVASTMAGRFGVYLGYELSSGPMVRR